MKAILAAAVGTALLATVAAAGPAAAGPNDPSRFDGSRSGPQKAMYHFNFGKPDDGVNALHYVRNHLKALREYGDFAHSRLVVIAQGNELHAFSRRNRAAFPDAYARLKELADQGVEIRICANAARARGYKPDEFYDVVTVAPAAVFDIAKYGGEGYTYISATIGPFLTRDDIVAQNPEIED